MLNTEDLLTAGREQSGLSDLGDPSFREGLDVLVEAWNHEAKLTLGGMGRVRRQHRRHAGQPAEGRGLRQGQSPVARRADSETDVRVRPAADRDDIGDQPADGRSRKPRVPPLGSAESRGIRSISMR